MKFKRHKKIKKFDIPNAWVKFRTGTKDYRIEWYYGNICNERCSYCFNASTLKEYYRNMTEEETNKSIEFINSIPNLHEVIFIGGEPSCFKYFLSSVRKIKSCYLNILTNGEDEVFMEELMKLARQDKPMLICSSAHYEVYLRDKQAYLEHIERLVHMSEKYKFALLEFNVLLDKEKTKEYKELIEFLYAWKKKSNIELSISYVRRDYNAEEFIKNYAVTQIFDKEICEDMQSELKGDRSSFLRPNKYYHTLCPAFTKYAHISLDGKLEATCCSQMIRSDKSIFDDDFDLQEEIRNHSNIECCCKHQPNNGACKDTHGYPPID